MPSGPLMLAGRKAVCEALLVSGLKVDPQYHLFQNNTTPMSSDTLGSYTEADFTGYASVNAVGWSAPVTSSGHEKTLATSVLFQVGSSPTVGNNIYGYYVTDNNRGGALVWAERFTGAPLSMTVAGDAIVVTPEFQESSEF